ncbi:MAG: B12-binding domain-containing radical SAM protein [Candidatus Helarchaeota archaeon]
MNILIIDALGSERGSRRFTRDVIIDFTIKIAGVLKNFSINSKIVLAEQFLQAKKLPMDADHLFISAMTMDFPAVKRILKKWSKLVSSRDSETVKILGGPITAAGTRILLNLDIDLGIIGEAEVTLTELIKHKIFSDGCTNNTLGNISGIIFKSNQEIIENIQRPFLSKKQLNSFQPSTEHIQDYPGYRAARIYIECVRGCSNFLRTKLKLPNGRMCNDCGTCTASDLAKRFKCPLNIPPGCGYCSVPMLYGPSRSRTIDNIISEIKELIELGALRLILGASDFLDFQRDELVAPQPLTDPIKPSPNYPQLEELLSRINDIITGTDIFVFIENIKASLFTEQAAKLIATYLPNTTFSIGCETGSKTHSKLLGRSSSPNEVFNAVRLAKKYNLRVHTYFIHGLPGQTLQTAIETKRFMQKLANEGIEKVTVYKFKPIPMSAFENIPPPPKALSDKASKMIVDTAIRINHEKKQEYLGSIERVIISEFAKKDKSKVIGYSLRGGPTILIDNGTSLIGKIVQVKINKVYSDKLLGGTINSS